MSSVNILVRYCPLRGWFFQRHREPLSIAAQNRLFSHQSCQPAGFQPVRIPRSTNVNGNTAAVFELVSLPSGLCQLFNTHRSSIQGRFSPIRF
jgi:hypothetical protein